MEQLLSIVVGSTFNRVNISQIKEFKLLVPSREEQNVILTFIKTRAGIIDTELSALQTEISLLQEYRQALISEAVTGKIDVREYVMDEES